jgi:hypothetical protein
MPMPDHADYLTVADIAAAVGRTPKAVRQALQAGKLAGAYQQARVWFVPAQYADPAVYTAAVGRPGQYERGG